MKNITFTSAGIALLILLQLGTLSFMIFGRHRAHQGREHHQKNMEVCPASFKEHDKGHGGHHRPHHGRGDHEPMFLEGLDLTPEQQSKIDALRTEHKKSEEAINVKVKELRAKQFQLLKEEKLD